MGDYFKPWRRKIGVVTLVMACVFAATWIRSFNVADCAQWDFAVFCSGEGNLYVTVPIPLKIEWAWPEWTVEKDADIESALNEVKWRWRSIGFGYAEVGFFDTNGLVILAPYWSLVIPLSLLSAWLLLSKPRNREKAAAPST